MELEGDNLGKSRTIRCLFAAGKHIAQQEKEQSKHE